MELSADESKRRQEIGERVRARERKKRGHEGRGKREKRVMFTSRSQ